MAEPTLILAPHEVAPGMSQYRKRFTFHTLWEEQKREFIGEETQAQLGELIFFCLADEPERGNFVSAWTPQQAFASTEGIRAALFVTNVGRGDEVGCRVRQLMGARVLLG